MKRKHNFKDRTGEKHLVDEDCWITIIAYRTAKDCDIKFENGVILYNRQFGDIKRGNVFNPFHLSVYGVGYIGVGEYKPPFKDRIHKIHKTWNRMMEREYSNKCQITNPTYVSCSVNEEWHCFQNFANWSEKNYVEGFHLDKDILFKGNKIYSAENCCFVPIEINSLFTKCDKVRGEYPIGVTKKGNKYEARVSKNKNRESQGLFDTPEEAFQAYKVGKELWIKEVADRWKPFIKPNVYEAMYAYEVEITD